MGAVKKEKTYKVSKLALLLSMDASTLNSKLLESGVLEIKDGARHITKKYKSDKLHITLEFNGNPWIVYTEKGKDFILNLYKDSVLATSSKEEIIETVLSRKDLKGKGTEPVSNFASMLGTNGAEINRMLVKYGIIDKLSTKGFAVNPAYSRKRIGRTVHNNYSVSHVRYSERGIALIRELLKVYYQNK